MRRSILILASLTVCLYGSRRASLAAPLELVRLSVKRLLDERGERPPGRYQEDAAVRQAIVEANGILERCGADFAIELTETVDLARAARFLRLRGVEDVRRLEAEARVEPRRYALRPDAINVYVLESLDAEGVSSFPGQGEIIAVNGSRGFRNGGAGWLHEIGHFLGLTHTFECLEPGCDPGACSGAGAMHADAESLVLCDDTCPDDDNVLGAHAPEPGVARLSACQLEAMRFELRDPRGTRRHVIGTLPQRATFRRGDADADARLTLADAVAILRHAFQGLPADCVEAHDADDDGSVQIADAVLVLGHLFRGGPAPTAPHGGCGVDPTPDALGCDASGACGEPGPPRG